MELIILVTSLGYVVARQLATAEPSPPPLAETNSALYAVIIGRNWSSGLPGQMHACSLCI